MGNMLECEEYLGVWGISWGVGDYFGVWGISWDVGDILGLGEYFGMSGCLDVWGI